MLLMHNTTKTKLHKDKNILKSKRLCLANMNPLKNSNMMTDSTDLASGLNNITSYFVSRKRFGSNYSSKYSKKRKATQGNSKYNYTECILTRSEINTGPPSENSIIFNKSFEPSTDDLSLAKKPRENSSNVQEKMSELSNSANNAKGFEINIFKIIDSERSRKVQNYSSKNNNVTSKDFYSEKIDNKGEENNHAKLSTVSHFQPKRLDNGEFKELLFEVENLISDPCSHTKTQCDVRKMRNNFLFTSSELSINNIGSAEIIELNSNSKFHHKGKTKNKLENSNGKKVSGILNQNKITDFLTCCKKSSNQNDMEDFSICGRSSSKILNSKITLNDFAGENRNYSSDYQCTISSSKGTLHKMNSKSKSTNFKHRRNNNKIIVSRTITEFLTPVKIHSPNIGPQNTNIKKAKLHRMPEFYGGESNTGFEEMMGLLVNLSGNRTTEGTSQRTIDEPEEIEKSNSVFDKSHSNIMKLLNDWPEEYKTEETTNVNRETSTKNSCATEFSIYNSPNMGSPKSNIKESKSQDVLEFSVHEANTGFKGTLDLLVNSSGNRTAQRTSKETINEATGIGISNSDFDESHFNILKLLNDWSEEYKTEETTNVNRETSIKNSVVTEFSIYNSPNMDPPKSNTKESKSQDVLEFSVHEANTGFEGTLDLLVNLSGNRTAQRTSKATINEATEIGKSNFDFDESHSKIMKLLNDWSEKSTIEVTSNVTTATKSKISPTRDSRMLNSTINHSSNMDQQNNIKKSKLHDVLEFSCDESNTSFEEMLEWLANLSGNRTAHRTSKTATNEATEIGKSNSDFDESHSKVMKLLNDWSGKSIIEVTSNVTTATKNKISPTRDSRMLNSTINHSSNMDQQNNIKKSKLHDMLEFSCDESNTSFEEMLEWLANLSGNRTAHRTSKTATNEATEIGKSNSDFDESHSKVMKLLNDWSGKSIIEVTSNVTTATKNKISPTRDSRMLNSTINHSSNMDQQNNIKKSKLHDMLEFSCDESNTSFEEMLEWLANLSGNRTAHRTSKTATNEATEIGKSNSDFDESHSKVMKLLNDWSGKSIIEVTSNVTTATKNKISPTRDSRMLNSTINHSSNMDQQNNIKKSKLHDMLEFSCDESNTSFEEMLEWLANLSGNRTAHRTSKTATNEATEIGKPNSDFDESHFKIMKLLNDWSGKSTIEVTSNVTTATKNKISPTRDSRMLNSTINHSSNMDQQNNIKKLKLHDMLEFSCDESNTSFEETLELLANLSGNRTAHRTSKATINEATEIGKSNFDFDESHSKIMKLLNDWSGKSTIEVTSNVTTATKNKISPTRDSRMLNSTINHSSNMDQQNNIKKSKLHDMLEFSCDESNTSFEETLELLANLSGNRTAHRTSKATINEATEIGKSNFDFDESHSKIIKLLNDWSEKSTAEETSNETIEIMNKNSATTDCSIFNSFVNHLPHMGPQNTNIKKSNVHEVLGFSVHESNVGFEEMMELLVNISGNRTAQGTSNVTVNEATEIAASANLTSYDSTIDHPQDIDQIVGKPTSCYYDPLLFILNDDRIEGNQKKPDDLLQRELSEHLTDENVCDHLSKTGDFLKDIDSSNIGHINEDNNQPIHAVLHSENTLTDFDNMDIDSEKKSSKILALSNDEFERRKQEILTMTGNEKNLVDDLSDNLLCQILNTNIIPNVDHSEPLIYPLRKSSSQEDPLSEHKLEENESDLLDFLRNVEEQVAEPVKDLADSNTANSLFSSGCQYSYISQNECIAQKNIMFNELLWKTMAANKKFIIKNSCENVDRRDIKKVQVQQCGKCKIYTIVKTEISRTDLTVNEDNLEQENADDVFKNTELNGGTHNGVFIFSNNGDDEADEKLLRAFNRVGTDKSLLYDMNDFGTQNAQINKMDIITKIQEIFSKVRDDFSQSGTSSLKFRRQRFENCNFHDDRLQLKPIGEAKMVNVNYSSVASQPKFCLMMYILEKVMELLDNNSKITKREIFYQIKNIIGFQCIVDRAINAVSCMLNVGPWRLNIIAQKGLVYGNLRLTSSSSEVVNCNVPGTLIPQDVDDIVKFESEAYFILVVEKESIFHKLLDENLPNRLVKPFIMITGKGFPDLNTQLFLKKLWMVMSIPVFILVDADPYGISIMINYRFGSLKHAHLSHYLAVPKAKWLGVFPSEITKLNITRQSLSERERNVARNLLKSPYMMRNPKIAEELNVLLERNVKAGIEGLIKNDKFLSDFYFPVKFYNQDYV